MASAAIRWPRSLDGGREASRDFASRVIVVVLCICERDGGKSSHVKLSLTNPELGIYMLCICQYMWSQTCLYLIIEIYMYSFDTLTLQGVPLHVNSIISQLSGHESVNDIIISCINSDSWSVPEPSMSTPAMRRRAIASDCCGVGLPSKPRLVIHLLNSISSISPD